MSNLFTCPDEPTIHYKVSFGWYFLDENWNEVGPYLSHHIAVAAQRVYNGVELIGDEQYQDWSEAVAGQEDLMDN